MNDYSEHNDAIQQLTAIALQEDQHIENASHLLTLVSHWLETALMLVEDDVVIDQIASVKAILERNVDVVLTDLGQTKAALYEAVAKLHELDKENYELRYLADVLKGRRNE